MKKSLATLALMSLGSASLSAASVILLNPSFESPTAGLANFDDFNGATPDDWSGFGSRGMQNQAGLAGVDGDLIVFLQGGATGDLTGGSLSQQIDGLTGGSSSLLEGDIFTLTLGALNQNSSPSFDFDIRTVADPALGSSLLTGGAQQSPAVAGGWTDYVVSGTVDADYTGDVWLVLNTNGPQVRIDNARLDYEAIPEPSTSALLGIGAIGLLARRRR